MPDITETEIILLNSEYRTEFKHLKQLIDDFEVIAKEEDDEGEVADAVELYKSQLATLQASFRYYITFIHVCQSIHLLLFILLQKSKCAVSDEC